MRRAAATLFWLAGTASLPANREVTFTDAASRAGLRDVIVSGGPKKNYVLEVNGSGACWLDYDNDGWMDLYLVNGATLAELQGKAKAAATNHLYRNNGDGTFTDVTAAAGVPGKGWGFGCAAADYDNDGHVDLLVTNFGPNILYRNRGDGTFTDVTEKAGVGGGPVWHAGPAFGDYDADGFVDLFVPGYLDFDIVKPELKSCEYAGLAVHACGPLGYRGAPNALYRNNGDGTFTDVTEKAGVADRRRYFSFQAVFEDFDNDGRPDLFVANDSNPNYLYRNKGDGTFEETGVPAGVAYSADGKEMSSMGVAVGDYDGDGWMDLFITTFANDNYVLFHNDGGGIFSDVSYPSGLGEPTIPYLGWATAFLDYDNDGRLDVFVANGHVYPEVDRGAREKYRQPLQLFRNLGDGKFGEVSQAAGLAAIPPQSARGGAYCDYDNDGDLDVVVSVMDDKPQLLRNDGGNRGNWLSLQLTGTKSNRMGIGARIRLTAPSASQYAAVRAGGSYLSSDDPRVHFGLGAATRATVEIRWPSGTRQVIENVAANQYLPVMEPSSTDGAGR
jgi:hypothetical protein